MSGNPPPLSRDGAVPDLDFPACVAGVSEQDFRGGWAGRHPLDSEYDFVHQTGRFTQEGKRLAFVFRHELRVGSPGRLVSESGAVYAFGRNRWASPGERLVRGCLL